MSLDQKKLMTLAFAKKDKRILLGRKKRGFGMAKWNGLGGKVAPGETVVEAMKRECFEEAKIKVQKYQELGLLNFHYVNDPDMKVHVFMVDEFAGKEEDTEEMEVGWFDADSLPYKKMWPDDVFWMPYFIDGKEFTGEFFFDKNYQISKHKVCEISKRQKSNE